ncbi:MAG: hypothetical protein EHM48_05620 [Planctomycetaceae bacterium]|nr:MAG: hypothetical protein EHM48_05620 [Planctomycetaceae bacterium]
MASTTPVTNASTIQMDYMNLLVTQLRNQDPMSPMDNNQMSTQLTQLSSLQQLENLNSNFAKILQSTQTNQTAALIGKEVSFIPDGASEAVSGKVESVLFDDGQALLKVGSMLVDPAKLLSITEPASPATNNTSTNN